jgi:hypothetical protein
MTTSNLLWDIVQARQIRKARNEAGDAKKRASEASSDARSVNERVEHLALIAEAMWELLKDTSGFDDEVLLAKISEVDLRDGRADGRRQAKAIQCQSCSRMVHPRHSECLYCNADIVDRVPFDSVK